MERFNGRIHDELLNESLFLGLDHARQKLADYNTARPHSAIGYQTPAGLRRAPERNTPIR